MDAVEVHENVVAGEMRESELRVHQVEFGPRGAQRGADRDLVMQQVVSIILGTDGEAGAGDQAAHVRAETGDPGGDPLDDLLLLDDDERMLDARGLVGLEMRRLLLALQLDLSGARHRRHAIGVGALRRLRLRAGDRSQYPPSDRSASHWARH
jgi:hypothetical protein